jgi:hemerythrin superfamily protein
MDFIQTIKAEHAKVLDLLDKLADTTAGALKTRERLAGQLRALLTAHARKEEAYLYPALRRSEAAGEFLAGATPAHDETALLAAALDDGPKDEDGFVERVQELRRAVGAHAREEERLLPGLRRMLDEEALARLDEAMAGDGADFGTTAAELTQRSVDLARRAADLAAQGTRRFVIAGAPGGPAAGSVAVVAEILGETAQSTADDLQAIATCTSVAAGGMQEMRAAWMDWFERTLRVGARASQSVLRCSTLEQVASVQRDFVEESMGTLLEGSARMLRISGRIAEEACRPIEARAGRPERREAEHAR